MIYFKEHTTLTIVTGFDEVADNITEETTESFNALEPVDANIIDDNGGLYVDLEFGNGGVAFGVQRASFVEVAS